MYWRTGICDSECAMVVGAGRASLTISQTAADLMGFTHAIAIENESSSSELQSYERKCHDEGSEVIMDSMAGDHGNSNSKNHWLKPRSAGKRLFSNNTSNLAGRASLHEVASTASNVHLIKWPVRAGAVAFCS